MDLLAELETKLRLTMPDCEIDTTRTDEGFVLSVRDHGGEKVADVEWYNDGHSIWWNERQPVHPGLVTVLQAVNEIDNAGG